MDDPVLIVLGSFCRRSSGISWKTCLTLCEATLKRLEDSIQIGIVDYLRMVLPERDYRVFAIPNGGARSKPEAAIMKATGTLAGVFDVQILGPSGRCWFVEVKKADGRLSVSQRAFETYCIARGVPYVVARSIDDVKLALSQWGLSSRDTTSPSTNRHLCEAST
jgi:hypothetical protein